METGDNVAIGGFIIDGTAAKKVLVRALGPTLGNFGIANPLADPTLELHDQNGVIATNDNWMDDPQQKTEIQNSGFAPPNNVESAVVATLQPGNYTAILAGKNNGTGVGVIEIYNLDPAGSSRLHNISTRGLVGSGDNVLIAGTVLKPNNGDAFTVFVRALGPTLNAYGISNFLVDPVLELHDGNGVLLATNDNWRDTQEADIAATGMQPPNDTESAILITLYTGNWTAIVRGAGDTGGVAVAEVYSIP